MSDLLRIVQIKRRWEEATGASIPEEIACLPLEAVERKLTLLEDKNTVCCIPRNPVAVVKTASDSLELRDNQDAKNSNAYGS